MSRRPSGHQRTWTRDDRPCPFLWPWRYTPLYPWEDRQETLGQLNSIWTLSRNYAALIDALQIITEADIPCPWATTAAAQAIGDPRERKAWEQQYCKDLVDVVRAETYELGRSPDDDGGLALSRAEAADYAAEWLRGTLAATTGGAVLKLLSRMKRNEARAPGRYYLSAGAIRWRDTYFPPGSTKEQGRLIWKWRHRSVVRGSARLRDAEQADLIHVRRGVDRGEHMARETLELYKRLQREDKLTR